MKIRKLQLKNIGVFDDETIEFQPCPTKDKAEIHIFTGQNGSGKTTILQSLASVFDDTKVDLSAENIASKLHHYGYIGMDVDYQLSNNFRKRYRPPGEFEVTFANGDRTKLQSKSNQIDYITSPVIYSYSGFASGRKNISSEKFIFAVFAFSGYRKIEYERVEALYEPKDFNPLSQSLNFFKDYSKSNQLTINQLIANNISKSAIEKERNEEKSKKFTNVLKSIEQAIYEITGWKVEFDIETEPTNLITKVNGEELDFDVLPDGLRSLISWIADLLGRVDLLKWQDDLPIFEKNLILLLDEIEVHLHPAWQRKVLPVVQKLFKNSQIFVSTHSPFVVNSVDDAWVYKLELENGKAKVGEPIRTENSNSITQVLREIFDVYGLFGKEVQDKIDELEKLRNKILSNGSNEKDEKDFLRIAKKLYDEPSDQVKNIVKGELQQLSEIKGKKFSI